MDFEDEEMSYNTVREDARDAFDHVRSEVEELMLELEKEAEAIAALPQDSPETTELFYSLIERFDAVSYIVRSLRHIYKGKYVEYPVK